jgi:23S rRNA pseudouridine1911/1915/1917 synthase
MAYPPFHILLEDNHLLAVVKPADLPTMGVDPSRPSLFSLARQYLKEKFQKPGNVYLGVVSRLDACVTGVVILARTSKAARRLTEQFRDREVRKLYWALVPQPPEPPAANLVDWLRKDERLRKMLVCDAHEPGAVEARLSYRTLRELDAAVLLEIELRTGRKHQIRVQLAARRLPILGDRQYGSRSAFTAGIALHARQLGFVHPVRKTPIELVAPVPGTWHRFGVR